MDGAKQAKTGAEDRLFGNDMNRRK